MISQEGKALLSFWAWQKVRRHVNVHENNALTLPQDQLQTRIHLPEKLQCFGTSPDGVWAAGGSPSGHIYLWEVSPKQPPLSRSPAQTLN